MLVKYSRPFKSYPFNVISLSKSFSEQLVKEKVYLVIEAYFNFSLNKPSAVRRISYRIIDEGGTPAIYEANGFEIVSGNLDGYYLAQNRNDYIIMTHKLIFEANPDKFWDTYFESTTNEGKNLLKSVIKDLASKENIPEPMLE